MENQEKYWSKRYAQGETGWDIGYVSSPIKEYIDQLTDKGLRILIPGAGNGYEAEYLHNKGFDNVYVVDISSLPLDALRKRVPDFPEEHLLLDDFFELKGQYDLIIEQTFFCAIPPSKRPEYVKQMNRLLKKKGKIVGLLFDFPLTEAGPPYGGSLEEYKERFENSFEIQILKTAYNSIKPRSGKELFFKLKKYSSNYR